MKILAIDTSGLQAGAAIIETTPYILCGEIFLNARTGEKSYTHSEILMPGIEQLFKLTRLTPENIDCVAYTNGPGSFTGLRIGASCALGIARALNVPAVPVPTLDALAYNALGTGKSCMVVPMLDARRGQVYTAIYERCNEGKITRKTDYMALPVEELSREIQKHPATDVLCLGDGADIYKLDIPNLIPSANNNRLRAASAAVWAAEKILSGYQFPKETEILYVRAPQAIREKKT